MRGAKLILAALMCAAQPSLAADGNWRIAEAGGSIVSLPNLLVEDHDLIVDDVAHGTAYRAYDGTFSLSHYWVASAKNPRPYLSALYEVGNNVVTYQVDRPDMGVLSGFIGDERTAIFYAVCRRREEVLACLTMQYPADQKARFDSVITRVVRSFRLR